MTAKHRIRHFSEAEGDSEEDDFSAEPLNLTPIKPRNFVKRNESYCHAVNRTMSPMMAPTPYGKRVQRPGRVISPRAVRGETPGKSPQESPTTENSRTFITRPNEPFTSTPRAVYPTSTVAHPTPPVGSTSDFASSRLVPPRVPPRMDSVEDVRGNYVISQQLSSGKVSVSQPGQDEVNATLL